MVDNLIHKVASWLYSKVIEYYLHNHGLDIWEDLIESGTVTTDMLVEELALDTNYTTKNLTAESENLIHDLSDNIWFNSTGENNEKNRFY